MSRMSLRSVILTGFMGAIVAAPAFGFGVGLQPTTVEMEFEPGDLRRQVVNIANVHQEKTISLTLGLADWSLDENGQIKLAPPGETESSAAEWVRFSPAFITLKPGESEQIVVDMSTPVRLKRSGDYRFALLASTILPEERAGGSGVWKKYQIASLFYMTTGDARSEPKIVSSGIMTGPRGETTLGMRVENTGNSHARLEGMVNIQEAGKEVRQVPVGNLVILDAAARNYVLPIGEPVSADAVISVTLDNIFAPQTESGTMSLPAYAVMALPAADMVEPSDAENDEIEPVVEAAAAPVNDVSEVVLAPAPSESEPS